MNIKFCSLFFSLLAIAVFASAQNKDLGPPIPLPHEKSDISTDSDVKWGLLKNGMRYAILPNAEPPNRVSLRLFVDAGSFMENEDQQGLAHFLEHMAFNGTTNFPAGEMVEYFQRLGMGFGNHTNAHTSFNETVYKLEMPNTEGKTLAEGFQLLRDYAEGMLFGPDEIDKERGIILSEKRSRDSVGWRTFVEQMKFMFPEHQISHRMPIGTEEVIKKAPRERFVEFYENWYTPNRMAIIVVGDIKVDAIEKLIHGQFDSLPGRIKRADPSLGKITKRGAGAHYHYEKESGETTVSIEAIKPRINPPDNKARRAADLRLMLGTMIVNRRLERIAKREESPISAGTMNAGDFYDLGFALNSGIEADCKAENWKEALGLIEQELRKALQFGFTKAELAEAVANIQNHYKEMAQQAGTRKSRDLANQIGRRLGTRRIFTNPVNDLPRVTTELESITAEQVRDLLRKLWGESYEKLVFVSGNAVIENPEVAILGTFQESAKIAVTPPKEKEVGSFAYAKMPDPGVIAERKEIEDLETTQLRFTNNVRANLKVTDFEDEVIYVKIRFGGGLITEPKDQAGLSFFLGNTFDDGGLEAHSIDDLQQLFAGKSVSVGFGIDDDAFTLAGGTTPDDLENQLLLMRAYLTNPGYREEAATEFRRNLDYIYQQIEHTPGGFAQNRVARFLRSGDSRFGYPPRATAEAIKTEDAKKWISRDLAKGYLEVTLVGDFDKEKTIQLLAKTLGNLPERDAKKPDYTKERLVKFPAAGTKVFEFKSEIPKATTIVHWPTIDIFDIKKTRRIGMLGSVLDDRLRIKIREDLGDAYSPVSHNIPSDTWKDYGYMFANVTVDPAQAESVSAVISDIAKELATGASITKDELDRAIKPQITQIEEMRRSNRYWMGSVLESSQEYPQRLEWSRTFVEDYKKITVEEVNALAKEFLKSDTQVTVIVKPTADE